MSDVSITTRIDGAAETKKAIDGIVTGLNALTSDGDKASRSVGSLTLKFTELNQAVELAKKAWSTISATASQFINAAAEDQAEMARLSGAVNAAGINFENVSDIIDQFNNDLALLAGTSDENVSKSFQRMIGVTKDVQSAMNATTLAADIAKARNIELADASRVVEQAMIGNLRGLKQLGIQLEDDATATEALVALQEKFGNGLEANAETYATVSGRFQESVGRFQESVGNLLLPALTKTLEALGGFFRMLSDVNIQRIYAMATAVAFLAGSAGVMMLATNIGTLMPMIARVVTAFGAWALSAAAVTLQFSALTAAGLAVGFVFYELAKNIETVGEVFSGLGGEVAVTAKAMWQAAKGDFKEAWTTITVESYQAQQKTNAAFKKLSETAINDLSAMKRGVQEIWSGITGIFSGGASAIPSIGGGAITNLPSVSGQDTKKKTEGIGGALGTLKEHFGTRTGDFSLGPGQGQVEAMSAFAESMKEFADASEATTEKLEEQKSIFDAWFESVSNINRAFEGLRNEMEITGDLTAAFFDQFIETSNLAGSVITEVFSSSWDMFTKGMGDAVANMLIFGKDFMQSMKELGKQIAAMIISTLVQITLQRILQWGILKMLNIAQGTQEIGLGLAKVYLNSFASAAAIPMVGWSMAPGVAQANLGMATAGVGQAFIQGAAVSGVAASAAGGMDFIPDTGSYTLHRGERVVNAAANMDLMAYLKLQRDARSGGAAGGGRPVIVQMQFGGPVIFDDIAEAEFIDRIQRGLSRTRELEA